MGIFLSFKIGDVVVRGTYTYFLDFTTESNSFLIELIFGGLVPFFMLFSSRVRENRRALMFVAILIVAGVAYNRINVFIVAYQPFTSLKSYFPAVGEIAVTAGLVALLMFVYKIAVCYLPVISAQPLEEKK